MKIWNTYSQIVTEPFQKYLGNPSKNTNINVKLLFALKVWKYQK